MTQKRLNYHTATIEEMAKHMLTISRAAVSSAKQHHKDNPEILEKIEKAIKLWKVLKLELKLAESKEAASE